MLRLKDLRKSAKMTQQHLATLLGITQATLSGWENGKFEIDINSVKKISQIFNVSSDYLLGFSDIPDNPSALLHPKSGIKIPVLGKVQAGIPIDAIEEILDYEEITPEMASQGKHFALMVRGDSMYPRFVEGDVVIVRCQNDVDTGDIAVILVNGNDATVKKIKKSPQGITLIPLNAAYDYINYTNEDIERLPVQILGKVVELRGKF